MARVAINGSAARTTNSAHNARFHRLRFIRRIDGRARRASGAKPRYTHPSCPPAVRPGLVAQLSEPLVNATQVPDLGDGPLVGTEPELEFTVDGHVVPPADVFVGWDGQGLAHARAR